MTTYGIIGNPLSHSFSKKYFTDKFLHLKDQNLIFKEFEIENVNELQKIISANPSLRGLNVTYPFKEKVIDVLNEIDNTANEIGAVNVIKITNGKLKGYNTDIIGFETTLKPLLKTNYNKALILGTGGSAKAVSFVLKKLNINYFFVSRKTTNKFTIKYDELNSFIKEHKLIINTTPLGMYPDVDNCPVLPYESLSDQHLLYDLIYNPKETLFLQKGKRQGATIINGMEMLKKQADAAWHIWNK